MKKTLSVLLAGFMCLTTSSLTVSAANTFRSGDIDGNGVVDITDLSLLNDFLAGAKSSTNQRQQQRLDVNQDSVYDQRDRVYLNDILAKRQQITTVTYSSDYGLPTSQTERYYVYDGKTHDFIKWYDVNPVSSLSDKDNTSFEYPVIKKGVYEREVDTKKDEYDLYGVGVFNGGSFFVIDPHTILTAAHCCGVTTSTLSIGTSRPTLRHIRGRAQNGRAGVDDVYLTIDSIHIPEKYVSTGNAGYDYAMIIVKEDLSMFLNREDFFNPGMVSSSIVDTKTPIYISGFRPDLLTGNGIVNLVEENMIDTNILTGGGISGGPYYLKEDGKKTVVGIHHSTGGYGDRITPAVFNFIYNNQSGFRYWGDIDLNGKLESNDYTTLRNHLLGYSTIIRYNARSQEVADVNGDGTINSADLVSLWNTINYK